MSKMHKNNVNFDSYLKTVLRGQRHYQTFDSVIGYTQSSAAVGKVIWQWGRCEELLKPKKHVVEYLLRLHFWHRLDDGEKGNK